MPPRHQPKIQSINKPNSKAIIHFLNRINMGQKPARVCFLLRHSFSIRRVDRCNQKIIMQLTKNAFLISSDVDKIKSRIPWSRRSVIKLYTITVNPINLHPGVNM